VRTLCAAARVSGMCVAARSSVESTQSLWNTLTVRPSFGRQAIDRLHVDVAVVGGGITGVTSALLLKDAGRSVAVLEARELGSGVTAGTSAHITSVLDTRYHQLEQTFGREGAALAARSSQAAIEQIARLVERTRADCDFARVPGYLFTEHEAGVDDLRRELEAARAAGLNAELSQVPLPLVARAGICFPNQAQFNPLLYVTGLAANIPGAGSHVFEQARVVSIDEGEPCRIHLAHGEVLTADRVILATHVPVNRVLITPKLAQYRSYVVSGVASQSSPGLFWDTAEPYHYVRRQRVGDCFHWIVGGADHKTGQEPSGPEPFERVAEFAARIGLHEIEQRWSAQVVESVDGLPLIGKNAGSERVYVATGFSGNGMTFGTLSAMLLSDACLGRDNEFAEFYSASRIKPLASLASFVGENVDFPLHLLSDALRPPEVKSLSDIGVGDGKTVRVAGRRLAVYRDEHQLLHAVSPVCTHLGCHVKFNHSEKTWDCPCHGSRFGTDGSVLDGPAVQNLDYQLLDDDELPPSQPLESNFVLARPAL
jgi:glycine/D-amino acid oxidase-like deaminating enzyme/nitrite reductase/ring-hydroxylating ferredoxin subunit